MAKVSISEASKLVGIARQNLYKNYINTGKISVTTKDGTKHIDTSELIRVFGELKNIPEDDKQKSDKDDSKVTQSDKKKITDDRDNIIENYKMLLAEKDKLILHLQNELQLAHELERWLMEQIPKQIGHKTNKGIIGWFKDMF
ncbi:MAG: hypothetical protein HQK78_18590 [Desulfobacterales bacterium]|nr:hypothetical protein [Desulfobacterales bacterium]